MLFPTNICGSELGKFALRSRSAIAVLAISKASEKESVRLGRKKSAK